MANWVKYATVGGIAVGGGALCFVTGGLAAPFIGGLVGSAMGLSGAAATSAGLALLGGGAVAAGGGGVALGATVVAGAAAAAGAAGAGVLANKIPVENRCPECDSLVERQDKICSNCGTQLQV